MKSSSHYMYGVCESMSDCSVLCRYDITAKKITPTIAVPNRCCVVQIGSRVFISGGTKPGINTVSEFIDKGESSYTTVTKQPMKFVKFWHTVLAITNDTFVAIGGIYGNTLLQCCEEYSIAKNEWSLLPPLNRAKARTGLTLLNDKLLYAVGGIAADNEIEILDMHQKKAWTKVTLVSNELYFHDCPEAIVMSKNEILILSGHGENEAGIFNTETNVAKKWAVSMLPEWYAYNSKLVIGNKVYVFGYNGGFHIYDTASRTLEEIPYSSIF